MEQPLTAESAYAVLRDMPGIPLASRGEFPKAAGLYSVWADGALLYVGVSVNIHSRWRSQQHQCFASISAEYPIACLSWLSVEGTVAMEVESDVIRTFKPRFNKSRNPDWKQERRISSKVARPIKDVSVRLDDETYARVVQLAHRQGRSISNLMSIVAETYVNARM